MTKIYITVISIITVIAIMLGCFIHIFNRGEFSFKPGHWNSVSNTVTLSGDIDTIEVDLKYSGLTIEYGEDAHVEYTLPEEFIPDIELKNGVLSLIMKNSISLGNRGWNDFEITIVIPEGTELDKLNIKLDAGNIQMADIPAKDIGISCDAGNIELGNTQAETINVEVDAGNIEIKDMTADKATISADAGNIDLKDCSIELFYADADAGNIETHGCTIGSGEVKTDLGNIDLGGDIGDVQTHTSLGIVNVDN